MRRIGTDVENLINGTHRVGEEPASWHNGQPHPAWALVHRIDRPGQPVGVTKQRPADLYDEINGHDVSARAHPITSPPFTKIVWPVKYDAAGDIR
jgi:hypothetical protein